MNRATSEFTFRSFILLVSEVLSRLREVTVAPIKTKEDTQINHLLPEDDLKANYFWIYLI